MNFTLTSPEQLDLDSYQRTLKRIILVLAASSETSNNNNSNHQRAVPTDALNSTTEISLGSGGAFIIDTSVTVPDLLKDSAGATRLTSSQNYPLSFIVVRQLPALITSIQTTTAQSVAPVQYFIRLPLNPYTHGIQCQLSARRLCSKHVILLDRILRRLCDASPGAFLVGYSDGISGIDAGTEVVYSGENSSYQTQPRGAQYKKAHGLDQSIAAARDRGNVDVGDHVAGLVGHVEYLAQSSTNEQNAHNANQPISSKSIKEMKNELGLVEGPTASSLTSRASIETIDQTDNFVIEDNEGTLNYDFGLAEDMDQLIDVHTITEVDELHDMLWAN